jgi:hypothetical protein
LRGRWPRRAALTGGRAVVRHGQAGGCQSRLVLLRRVDVPEQFRSAQFHPPGGRLVSLRNSAHPLGGFVDGQQFRQQGATDRYGMAAFTLAGGDGYQCVAVVVVGAQHLADDGGATGLVDVEHKDGTLGVVSSIEGLQSDLDGGGFAQAVIGVFGAPDVADGVDIAVGSDAGTQFALGYLFTTLHENRMS